MQCDGNGLDNIFIAGGTGKNCRAPSNRPGATIDGGAHQYGHEFADRRVREGRVNLGDCGLDLGRAAGRTESVRQAPHHPTDRFNLAYLVSRSPTCLERCCQPSPRSSRGRTALRLITLTELPTPAPSPLPPVGRQHPGHLRINAALRPAARPKRLAVPPWRPLVQAASSFTSPLRRRGDGGLPPPSETTAPRGALTGFLPAPLLKWDIHKQTFRV